MRFMRFGQLCDANMAFSHDGGPKDIVEKLEEATMMTSWPVD
jgi:hypothetical protein